MPVSLTLMPVSLLPVTVGAATTTSPPDAIFVDLIIGSVMCVLGLVFLTIGQVRTRMSKNWVRTTGLIVNRRGTTEGWPDRNPTFGWTGPDGQIYRKTSSVYGGFNRLGRQVPLLVDPEQPSRAMMDTFVQKGTIFTVIGSVLGVFGLVSMAFGGYLAISA